MAELIRQHGLAAVGEPHVKHIEGKLWEMRARGRDGIARGWHLTIMSHGVVLFTASTRSRQEIDDLAAEARRLRSDVEIFIRPPDGAAYCYDRTGVSLRC